MFHPPRRIPARGLGCRELLRSQLPFSPGSNAAACRRFVTTIYPCTEDALGVWTLGKSARRAVGGPQRSARTRPTDPRQSGRPGTRTSVSEGASGSPATPLWTARTAKCSHCLVMSVEAAAGVHNPWFTRRDSATSGPRETHPARTPGQTHTLRRPRPSGPSARRSLRPHAGGDRSW
jgi:hypothetical protein